MNSYQLIPIRLNIQFLNQSGLIINNNSKTGVQMFESTTVQNAHIAFNNRLYGSPKLAQHNTEKVLVSENRLYPAAVAVLTKEYEFVCLAKNRELWEKFNRAGGRHQVLNAIEISILQNEVEDGPVGMRPYSIDEWVRKIAEDVEDASRHAAYGNVHHTLDALLKAAVECVKCLEFHVEREAVAGTPKLAAAIAELDGMAEMPELDLTDKPYSFVCASEGHPPAPPSKGDLNGAHNKATDPVGAESAA